MNPLISYFRNPAIQVAQPKHTTAGVNVTGAGREVLHNPIPYVLDDPARAVAARAGKVIHIHRMQLNDRDKARQMAANEREIAQWLGELA